MIDVVLVLLFFGVGTILWSTVGVIRVVAARFTTTPARRHPSPEDVVVLIAAHDEELVIAHTIRSAAALVPLANIVVVDDGSSDSTVRIAQQEGATVLALERNHGKAGALAAAIRRLGLADRFAIVLLLDADTQLTPDYLRTGLPLFADPAVVAVAGRATTLPERGDGLGGRIIVAHRERIYVSVQYLQKFGQAAAHANAVVIVPGFASMYRTHVLDDIDIDAEGLSIEDFNMTFEVHAKKLGRIAFRPSCAVARTQDPRSLHDYRAQVARWGLGFWQTVRRHGMHAGRFWAALLLYIAELLVSSVLTVLIAIAVVVLTALVFVDAMDGDAPTLASDVVAFAPPWRLLVLFLAADYALTVIASILGRQPRLLLYGFAFPVIRVLDAVLCLRALVLAFRSAGPGTWTSPRRRAIGPPDAQPASESSEMPATSSALDRTPSTR